jgi:superfamily II DNA or RNA helicase
MTDALWEPHKHPAMKFPAPRPFQAATRARAREAVRNGYRKIMVCSPTGSGKTIFAMYLIFEALERGKCVVFVCDRITLINQTAETAWKLGFRDFGVIQAQHPLTRPEAPFQIASAQTLARRTWPKADLIIVDEAHTQLSAWTDEVKRTDAIVIGLSATPMSKGLGAEGMFQYLINATDMKTLVGLETLVPMRVFASIRPDMGGAAIAGGEWTDRAAEERGMEIIGDVVSEWFRHARERQTIVFGATIRHCEEICRRFIEAGIVARVYCSTTPDAERVEMLAGFKAGIVQVLVSVEALAKGFDVPAVSCVIDCRPLRKSFSTWIQMIGRGLRCSPETGKTDCVLLDLSGNSARFAADYIDLYENGLDSLDKGQKLDTDVRKEKDEKEVRACPKCGFWPFMQTCLGCGHAIVPKALVEHGAGTTTEVVLGGKKLAESHRDLFGQCLQYAREHSVPEKQFWRAKFLYQQMTGQLPPRDWTFDNTPALPVSMETSKRIAYHNIRRIKGRAKYGL